MSLKNISTENLEPWLISWDLNSPLVKTLREYGEEVKLPARETIFSEGDPAGAMYLVLEGMVLVLRKDADGQERTVSIIVEGQSFGEVSLLVDQTRMATVAAGIDSLLLKVTPETLDKLEDEHPDVSLTFYKNMARNFAEQWVAITQPQAPDDEPRTASS